jgi:hypothetical protein
LDLRFSQRWLWKSTIMDMWCCVVWKKFTAISEAHTSSTFRSKSTPCKQQVCSKQSALRDHASYADITLILWHLRFSWQWLMKNAISWGVTPCSLVKVNCLHLQLSSMQISRRQLLAICLAYSLTLKIMAKCSSQTLVTFYQAAQHHISSIKFTVDKSNKIKIYYIAEAITTHFKSKTLLYSLHRSQVSCK